MAEFLIYNKVHWMNELTPEQIKEREKIEPEFQKRCEGCLKRDDIVLVKPDGYFTKTLKKASKGWPFRVVVIPGLLPDRAYKNESVTKNRRYSMIANDGLITTRSSLVNAELVDKEMSIQ